MIRILSRVVLIFTVILLSISFSKANYFDTEASNENLFNAGTFTVSDAATTLIPFNFGSLHPGDHVTKTINLKNSGTINITKLIISAVNLTGDIGLLDQLNVSVSSGSVWTNKSSFIVTVIPPGSIYDLSIDFIVPGDISADWQGKSINFDLELKAEQ